jgi:hypothetical protein
LTVPSAADSVFLDRRSLPLLPIDTPPIDIDLLLLLLLLFSGMCFCALGTLEIVAPIVSVLSFVAWSTFSD